MTATEYSMVAKYKEGTGEGKGVCCKNRYDQVEREREGTKEVTVNNLIQP